MNTRNLFVIVSKDNLGFLFRDEVFASKEEAGDFGREKSYLEEWSVVSLYDYINKYGDQKYFQGYDDASTYYPD